METSGENVVVSYGGRMLACYERGDRGMRNLAIVSLTRAGVPSVEVARLFGVRPERVYWLRRQASEGGSAALVSPMGRRVKLDRGHVARAYEMSDRGVAGCEIAAQLGVSGATISRLLARRPAREVDRLAAVEIDLVEASDTVDPVAASDTNDGVCEDPQPATRIGAGGGRSVYAGAMLLHPFLEKVGAGEVLSVLDSGPARRYDTSAVALAGTFAFALGSSSLEGSNAAG